MVTVLAWTAEAAGFESWFGHLFTAGMHVVGLISWAGMARYSLFVLKELF